MIVHLFFHLYLFGGFSLDPHTNDRSFIYSPLLVCSLGLKVSRVLSLPSGEELSVKSLSDPVSMTFPITLGSGSLYKCKYLNTSSGQWSAEGVTTGQTTALGVECQTNHLSTYAIFSGQ